VTLTAQEAWTRLLDRARQELPEQTFKTWLEPTEPLKIEGDKLFVERNGKKEQLLPETSEIFFRKGVEGRILFRYAAAGKVDALIDRRNNEDVIWRKTK